jgi:hypothetical protein
MSTVEISELSKIPFIDVENLHGRTIATLSFFAEGDWHLWVPTNNGIIKIKGWPSEGCYFGKEEEKETDAYLEFLNFIAQRCSWPSVIRPFRGLQQDFFNLCACVKKFDILFDQSEKLKTATGRLVATELEYLFSLCRSVFDLLQEIISAQWQTVHLVDQTIKKKQLPKVFSDIVLNSGTLRTEAELINRFHIPQPLAAFYVRSGPFFEVLRTFRDRFVHGGTTPEIVYVTEKGFAVRRTTKPFCTFNVWNQEHMLPNDLCSLRPIIGHIIIETLRACEDYAITIQSIIMYPPPIAPKMRFFIRGYFNDSLSESAKAVEQCLWWNNA